MSFRACFVPASPEMHQYCSADQSTQGSHSLEGTLKTINYFCCYKDVIVLLTGIYKRAAFPIFLFMLLVVPGPPIMCFHFHCIVFFQFASFQDILICHEKRNMNSDSENCYHWPNIVPRVLFSFSAGNNVFDLMLGGSPKNSLNLCPSSAIHYWVWINVGEALRGSSVLSLSPHSTNILSHTWLGKGWTKHSSLHVAAAPCCYYFVVEVNPCFKTALCCSWYALLSPFPRVAVQLE